MYPDVNIEGYSEKEIENLIKKFLQIKFPNNNESIFKIRYRKNAKKINFIFNTNLLKSNYLLFENNKIKISDLGLEYGIDNQGTGYHCPYGILLSQGKKSELIFKNLDLIDTKNIYSFILDLFGIKKLNP